MVHKSFGFKPGQKGVNLALSEGADAEEVLLKEWYELVSVGFPERKGAKDSEFGRVSVGRGF